MAKISNKTMTIRNGDVDELIQYRTFYTAGYGFWAELPGTVAETFDQLDDKEREQLFGDKRYARKYAASNEPHKRVVYGDTEVELDTRMKAMVTHLLTLSVIKEPVIIITFDGDDKEAERRKDREPKDPNHLGEVSLSLELKYCHRVTTSTGTAKFYEYREQDWHGEKEIVRHSVHVNTNWRSDDRIIADTPENRQFLEQLHTALGTLVKKLKQFTATPEDIQKVIDARQKLLTA